MFKVAEKKKENSPDFQGSGRLTYEDIEAIRANGGHVRISAWTKLPKNGGAPYISGFIEASKPYNGDQSAPQASDEFMSTPAIEQAQSAPVDPTGDAGDLPF